MIITTDSELARKAIDSETQQDQLSPSAPSGSRLPPQTGLPSEHHGLQQDANYYPDAVPSDSQEHLIPPPAFAPYEAEWFEVGYGDVVSHDEHLNTDGEALYRFLLTMANRSPSYRIHCTGSHNETRYRWVSSYDNQQHHHHNRNHEHHRSGGSSTRTESYSERVTDFDFYIDVMPSLSSTGVPLPPQPSFSSKAHTSSESVEDHADAQQSSSPIHWSVADDEPTYRGKMVREVECGPLPGEALPSNNAQHPSGFTPTIRRRKAKRKECTNYNKWVEQRTRKGLPPWVSGINTWNITDPTDPEVLRSSKSLREWADEYCASPKLLKEFVYTKVLYGWDMSQLETVIRRTIALAPYHGDIQVSFTPINSCIYIRPSNKLSRALSNKWLKFLSIIFLLFPFIWLFKRFHPRGGGKWEVCGGAYALKKWVPLLQDDQNQHPTTNPSGVGDNTSSNELPSYEDITSPSTSTSPFPPTSTATPGQSTASTSSSRILQTSQGPRKLIGQHEGEWFRNWEPIILRAVLTRYQSTIPLTSEFYERHNSPGGTLEGYHEVGTSIDAGRQPVLPTGPAFGNRAGRIFLP